MSRRARRLGETTEAMLSDLESTVALRLVEACGAAPHEARALGATVRQALCKAWAGPAHFYFPKGRHIDSRDKAMRMLDRFNGTNHLQLAQEFATTEINVYRVIKQYAREHARARHTDLYAGTEHAPPTPEKPEGVETLEQFTAVVATTLAKAGGLPGAEAEAAAIAVRDTMRRRWGGVQIHISKDIVLTNAPGSGYHGDLFDMG